MQLQKLLKSTSTRLNISWKRRYEQMQFLRRWSSSANELIQDDLISQCWPSIFLNSQLNNTEKNEFNKMNIQIINPYITIAKDYRYKHMNCAQDFQVKVEKIGTVSEFFNDYFYWFTLTNSSLQTEPLTRPILLSSVSSQITIRKNNELSLSQQSFAQRIINIDLGYKPAFFQKSIQRYSYCSSPSDYQPHIQSFYQIHQNNILNKDQIWSKILSSLLPPPLILYANCDYDNKKNKEIDQIKKLNRIEQKINKRRQKRLEKETKLKDKQSRIKEKQLKIIKNINKTDQKKENGKLIQLTNNSFNPNNSQITSLTLTNQQNQETQSQNLFNEIKNSQQDYSFVEFFWWNPLSPYCQVNPWNSLNTVQQLYSSQPQDSSNNYSSRIQSKNSIASFNSISQFFDSSAQAKSTFSPATFVTLLSHGSVQQSPNSSSFHQTSQSLYSTSTQNISPTNNLLLNYKSPKFRIQPNPPPIFTLDHISRFSAIPPLFQQFLISFNRQIEENKQNTIYSPYFTLNNYQQFNALHSFKFCIHNSLQTKEEQ